MIPEAELLGAVHLKSRRVSFGLQSPADVMGRIERQDAEGTRIRLLGFDREVLLALRVVGNQAVSDALAAAAFAWSRGLDTDAIVAGLESVTRLPGTLEPVLENQPFGVWIDQGRTEAALREALETLRRFTSRHLHVVLNAQVAPSERLALARLAEENADRVILSVEDIEARGIDEAMDDVLAGFRRPGRVRVEPERRRAIELALAEAAPGDSVLIAGGGRRTVQVLDDRPVACDDRVIAVRWLRQPRAVERRRSA